MNNKMKSKLAIALLTTMMATSAVPAFAANHSGVIDDFYTLKSGNIIREGAIPFLKGQAYETKKFEEFKDNGQLNTMYIGSGDVLYYHKEYSSEFGKADNKNYNTVGDILDKLNPVPIEELNQYNGKFVKLEKVGEDEYRQTKIDNPYTEESQKPNENGVNPDNPDTGGETTPSKPGVPTTAAEVDKKYKEIDAKLNDYENFKKFEADLNASREKYVNDKAAYEKAQKEHDIAAQDLDAVAKRWQKISLRKAEEKFQKAQQELNTAKGNLKESKQNVEKFQKRFDKVYDPIVQEINELYEGYHLLSDDQKAKLKYGKEIEGTILENTIIAADELLNVFKGTNTFEYEELKEYVEKNRGLAKEPSIYVTNAKEIKNVDKEMTKRLVDYASKEIERLISKDKSYLRSKDEEEIKTIVKVYENFLKEKEGEEQLNNIVKYNYVNVKKLSQYKFAPFKLVYTTPTAELIKSLEEFRLSTDIIKKWTFDLEEVERGRFEINGLKSIEERGLVSDGNRPVSIKIPVDDEIKSDNKLYFLLSWTPADSKINGTKNNFYYETNLKAGEDNLIYVNYNILNKIKFEKLLKLKTEENDSSLNTVDPTEENLEYSEYSGELDSSEQNILSDI